MALHANDPSFLFMSMGQDVNQFGVGCSRSSLILVLFFIQSNEKYN
jgi:hypothetical protein